RPAEEGILGPETLTKRHSIKRGGMAKAEFQDRCLKPLGHPSALTTSNTYALPLGRTNLTLPPACHRPSPAQLARTRVIWARLISNERRAPPESASDR